MKLFHTNVLLLTACVAGCATPRDSQPLPDTSRDALRAAALRDAEWNPSEYAVCDPATSSSPRLCHPLNTVDWDATTVCVAGTPTGSHLPVRRCGSLREYLNQPMTATHVGRHFRRGEVMDPSLTVVRVVMRPPGATPPGKPPSGERASSFTEDTGPLDVILLNK